MKDLSFHYTTPKMEQRNPDGQRINNRNQQDRKKKIIAKIILLPYTYKNIVKKENHKTKFLRHINVKFYNNILAMKTLRSHNKGRFECQSYMYLRNRW